MRRLWMMIALCSVLWVAMPSKSHAGLVLSGSIGGNYSLDAQSSDDANWKWGGNAEFGVGYRIWFISLDIAVMFDVMKEEAVFRPGIRLDFIGPLYLRVAGPFMLSFITDTTRFNVGALVGLGTHIPIPGTKMRFMLEANITPYFVEMAKRGNILPLEIRLGLAHYF